ncbi:hypothetical protein DFH08DRAFT_824124 [Mycena albidolilacea]|uniref:Uncharacterized protein n=1 Tax=Mycena albidolilacea TaxID=1033008 RepID=A0AAD7EB99_9AGAR|nr:hypothetical protein DFH08DRAFT_824124 [Mycena albidolilacea]
MSATRSANFSLKSPNAVSRRLLQKKTRRKPYHGFKPESNERFLLHAIFRRYNICRPTTQGTRVGVFEPEYPGFTVKGASKSKMKGNITQPGLRGCGGSKCIKFLRIQRQLLPEDFPSKFVAVGAQANSARSSQARARDGPRVNMHPGSAEAYGHPNYLRWDLARLKQLLRLGGDTRHAQRKSGSRKLVLNVSWDTREACVGLGPSGSYPLVKDMQQCLIGKNRQECTHISLTKENSKSHLELEPPHSTCLGSHPGGSAQTLYCLRPHDEENITEATQAFRVPTLDPGEYIHDDHACAMIRYGMNTYESSFTLVHDSRTSAGLTEHFPALVSPFELIDPSKPDHRKIFPGDPTGDLTPSATTVPDWACDALQELVRDSRLLVSRLLQELVNLIREQI